MSLDVYLYHKVYSRNITHNVNKMAMEAGIYEYLWRPEEVGIWKAEELIEPLTKGLERLKSNPEHYKQFEPENMWGSYDGLVAFVEDYLKHCHIFKDSYVEVDR